LAATSCCLSLDISLQSIKDGLESIKSIKGRLEIKTGKKHVRIIDDTYNANPTSFDVAIETLCSFNGLRYIVLGDMGELGDQAEQFHRDVGELAKRKNVDGLFTIGKLSINASNSFEKSLIKILDKDSTILIKGSRAMKMERIVNALMRDEK
jgi:UDP-N-acetylmuramoyl-tripeptide--D-alanyl-D-alanine ligase